MLRSVAFASALLSIFLWQSAAQAQAPRVIAADMNAIQGPRDMTWQLSVGSDRAAILLRPGNLAQLKLVHDEIGFKSVRFHGIFSDEMGVYREVDGQPVYDFSKVDLVYGSILGAGMTPFVELSFMPNDLASGTQTVFAWRANVTPPKDPAKWTALVDAFARHLVHRFGNAEVERWKFEVWNEPNLDAFWPKADQQAYFGLYDGTAATLKSVDASIPVGGPATAGAGWIPDFIAHVVSANAPVDFVSTHTYATYGGFLDENGDADLKLEPGANSIVQDLLKARDQVVASARPDLPIYFTEWGSSYSSRDPVHDAYLSAPFILDKVKKSEGVVQLLSYWTYTDLFEENGPPPSSFYGGFGLLNREGIRKAAFFAYKYLNELGATELQDSDAQSWLTRDGDNFAALMWNFSQPVQDASDRPFFSKLQPSSPVAPIEWSVSSLTPGRYRLTIHRTGFQANDAFSQYIAWGMPTDLTLQQIATLNGLTADAPETDAVVTVDTSGTFHDTIAMRTNDVVFASLARVP